MFAFIADIEISYVMCMHISICSIQFYTCQLDFSLAEVQYQ